VGMGEHYGGNFAWRQRPLAVLGLAFGTTALEQAAIKRDPVAVGADKMHGTGYFACGTMKEDLGHPKISFERRTRTREPLLGFAVAPGAAPE
jgi:hypothetical protein